MAPRPDVTESRYAVLIDAGSSGSRLFVYQWPDPASLQVSELDQQTLHSLPAIRTDPSWTKKTTPGISSYANRVDDIWSGHLEKLIESAHDIVPEAEWATTPIFFMATAGMRLLPETDRTRVLDRVCSLLSDKSQFYLPECATHVSVIDGETEGLFGWLALNYLLGPTKSYEDDTAAEHASYGFMDMGGASAQIAFSPNKSESLRHADDLYHVKLRTLDGSIHDWKVFVSTWLGFGANEARKRLSEYLVQSPLSISAPPASHNSLVVSDPCAPVGYSFNYGAANSTDYIIEGTGDFTKCLNRLVPLLNKELPCKDDPCLFNGIHVPAMDFAHDRLVGVSEYWYTANDIFDMGGKYDFTEFSAKAKQFCELPWHKIVENSKHGDYNGINKDYLSTACFKAAWIVSILHEGFGIPVDDRALPPASSNGLHHFLDPFQSAMSIDDVELSWTLGRAMLYASSQVPPSTQFHDEQVGYLPIGVPQSISDTPANGYVLGGELSGALLLPPGSVAPGASFGIGRFLFVLLCIFCIVSFFASNAMRRLHHVSYRLRQLSSWALCRVSGKPYESLDRNEDGDRLLEEGDWHSSPSGLVMKSYPVSPSESAVFPPRRLKSAFNLTSAKPNLGLGTSTSMLDLKTNAPSRVSSRLSMRGEQGPSRPPSSFDLHDGE